MPLISQPSPTGVAEPVGAATAAHRKSPSPKSSAWACSSNSAPTCSACAEARQRHQAVDGQPRAIATIDPQEGWEVDLVPAVAPGHEHAVEAGPQELLVHLLPVVGTCLRLSLALDEERP